MDLSSTLFFPLSTTGSRTTGGLFLAAGAGAGFGSARGASTTFSFSGGSFLLILEKRVQPRESTTKTTTVATIHPRAPDFSSGDLGKYSIPYFPRTSTTSGDYLTSPPSAEITALTLERAISIVVPGQISTLKVFSVAS